MAEFSSKDLQDLLDSQSDALRDLIFRFEQSQKVNSQQINDSIARLCDTLDRKFNDLSKLAGTNFNNTSSSDPELKQTLNKLNTTIGNGQRTDQEFAQTVQTNNKWLSALVTTAKAFKGVSEDAIRAMSNQLNYVRQMDVNGVITTYESTANAAKNAGISLDDLSEVSKKFKNVLISMNAAGMDSIQTFQKVAVESFDELNKQGISFTQKELYNVEGVYLEQQRKMGRVQELNQREITQQTINTAKIIDAVSKLTGADRSTVMNELQKGPDVVTQVALNNMPEEKRRMAQTFFASMGQALGPEAQQALQKLLLAGVRDNQVMQTLGGTFNDLDSVVAAFQTFMQTEGSQKDLTNVIQNSLRGLSSGKESINSMFGGPGGNVYAMMSSPYLGSSAAVAYNADIALKQAQQGEKLIYTENQLAKTQNLKVAQARMARGVQTLANRERAGLVNILSGDEKGEGAFTWGARNFDEGVKANEDEESLWGQLSGKVIEYGPMAAVAASTVYDIANLFRRSRASKVAAPKAGGAKPTAKPTAGKGGRATSKVAETANTVKASKLAAGMKIGGASLGAAFNTYGAVTDVNNAIEVSKNGSIKDQYEADTQAGMSVGAAIMSILGLVGIIASTVATGGLAAPAWATALAAGGGAIATADAISSMSTGKGLGENIGNGAYHLTHDDSGRAIWSSGDTLANTISKNGLTISNYNKPNREYQELLTQTKNLSIDVAPAANDRAAMLEQLENISNTLKHIDNNTQNISAVDF